jgi:hypothetical protein
LSDTAELLLEGTKKTADVQAENAEAILHAET